MKKTFLSFISSLALLISFSICAQSSSSLHIWNDEVEMRPYLTAIQFICQKLKPHIKEKKARINYLKNDFGGLPSAPNPYYNRTPRYLYLETYSYSNNGEQIYKLWTPFGQLNLLESGLTKNRFACSKNFLQEMKHYWCLQDVSNIVANYIYSNSRKKVNLYGPYAFRQQPWEDSNLQRHVYLIQEVNGYVFINDQDLSSNKLIIYSYAHLKPDQEEKGRNLFLRLSQGLSKL